MNEHAPGTGPELFPAERYEQLRSAALGAVTAAANGRGLALLMRQGMAAWMQAWASCTVVPSPERSGPTQHPVVRPELVAVLAEMAIAAAHGVVA